MGGEVKGGKAEKSVRMRAQMQDSGGRKPQGGRKRSEDIIAVSVDTMEENKKRVFSWVNPQHRTSTTRVPVT